MAKKTPISDQLRAAILNAEESRYRISKATGISESILSRFVRGDANLSMAYMDIVCDHLGLRLVAAPQPKKRKAAK